MVSFRWGFMSTNHLGGGSPLQFIAKKQVTKGTSLSRPTGQGFSCAFSARKSKSANEHGTQGVRTLEPLKKKQKKRERERESVTGDRSICIQAFPELGHQPAAQKRIIRCFFFPYPLKLPAPWGSFHLLQTKLPMSPPKSYEKLRVLKR